MPVGRYPIEEVEKVLLLPCNVETSRGYIAADLIKIFLAYLEKEQVLERIKPYLLSPYTFPTFSQSEKGGKERFPSSEIKI